METIIPEEHRWKVELFTLWGTIIGNMKNKVSIEKIEDDILYLYVSHPAWAHELHLLTPLIKKKINQHFAQPKINIIRFHNRVVPSIQKFYKKSVAPSSPVTQEQIVLTDQENSMLAPLASNPLQSIIAAYFVRCKKFKRGKDEKK